MYHALLPGRGVIYDNWLERQMRKAAHRPAFRFVVAAVSTAPNQSRIFLASLYSY